MFYFSDPRATTDVITNVDDIKDRIHNWDVLLKNIKAYYQVGLERCFTIFNDLYTEQTGSFTNVLLSLTIVTAGIPPYWGTVSIEFSYEETQLFKENLVDDILPCTSRELQLQLPL